LFSLLVPLPLCPPLFPYTTLFRSGAVPVATTVKVWFSPSNRVALVGPWVMFGGSAARRDPVPIHAASAASADHRASLPACQSAKDRKSTSELQSRSDLVCRLLLEK